MVDGADELAALAELLERERRTAALRLEQARADLAAIMDGAEVSNGDDEHDPEGPTVAYERARVEAVRRQAEAHLLELDDATRRLREGRFGRCERCGAPIGAERLAARPTARRCVACAAEASAPRRLGAAGRRRHG